jgi:hypothetical protein
MRYEEYMKRVNTDPLDPHLRGGIPGWLGWSLPGYYAGSGNFFLVFDAIEICKL